MFSLSRGDRHGVDIDRSGALILALSRGGKWKPGQRVGLVKSLLQ